LNFFWFISCNMLSFLLSTLSYLSQSFWFLKAVFAYMSCFRKPFLSALWCIPLSQHPTASSFHVSEHLT
jgi:hypothetical protein